MLVIKKTAIDEFKYEYLEELGILIIRYDQVLIAMIHIELPIFLRDAYEEVKKMERRLSSLIPKEHKDMINRFWEKQSE